MSSRNNLLLSVDNISKSYLISKHSLSRLIMALTGVVLKKDRLAQILKNISFGINRGETVGIMGKNGAGKSTLLSIISGVIKPTSGHIEKLGTISAALNVSAGFGPDFTGRQNAQIFCNLQGIASDQIETMLEKIKVFSELDKYYDLPVRTYSSGMRARLAFSCSAMVEADLVIIDETLSVGDASFKIKCLDQIKKMQNCGQSFLIVSHSPNLISNFCSRVLVIDGGQIVYDGSVTDGLRAYKEVTMAKQTDKTPSSDSVNLRTEEGFFLDSVVTSGHDKILLIKSSFVFKDSANYKIGISVKNMDGLTISGCSFFLDINNQDIGKCITFAFEFLDVLPAGQYFFDGTVYQVTNEQHFLLKQMPNFLSYTVEGRGQVSDLRHAGVVQLLQNVYRVKGDVNA